MAVLTQKTDVLGKRAAAHLLRRTTYHISKSQIERFAKLTPAKALDELFTSSAFFRSEPVSDFNGKTWYSSYGTQDSGGPGGSDRLMLQAWWLEEARRNKGIEFKLAFFLHNSFTASLIGTGPDDDYYDYLSLLHYYHKGNLKSLASRITRCNSMLRYLDGNKNIASSINENYSREFLELFTIGKGPIKAPEDYTTYTELDVQQAAKVLSGFNVKNRNLKQSIDSVTGIPLGIPVIKSHDGSTKTFSKAFDQHSITAGTDAAGMVTELEDFIAMVFKQEETARNFCRKLYRFFVHRNIERKTEKKIIRPLAAQLLKDDYDLENVVKDLLGSKHFYDEDDKKGFNEVFGGQLKSPLDLYLQSMVYFEHPVAGSTLNYYKFYNYKILYDIKGIGITLFQPESVAGYAGYFQAPNYDLNWFDTASIITRYGFAEKLLKKNQSNEIDLIDYFSNTTNCSDPEDAKTLVKELIECLFPEGELIVRPMKNGTENDRFDYFLNTVFLDGINPIDWKFAWQDAIKLDKQAINDVKLRLKNLLLALMGSPEYQCA
jgi:uncharacterized protein (DUF1800 family)